MKNLRIFTVLLILSFSSYAQSYNGKKDNKINVGYNIYGKGTGIVATYDYGLGDLFSIGLGGLYYIDNENNDYFIFARTGLHLGMLLDFPEQLDIYPGVNLGYLSRNDIGFFAYLGMRFFITEKIGLFAEIGNMGLVGISVDL